jgi:alkanesulfonate monooxygenase SsuD/methylene tetrahydromethanopterin reductase-like flavin-dependent oxidoreductase (luciferase family)
MDDRVTFGLGLVTGQRPHWDARSQAEVYQDILALCRRVEELGYDAVWFTEHHFFDDSYLPSVLPMLAAVAAQTSRIRLGTAVLTAHFYDPLRLAEDTATVDLLSQGRLVLGLGHGWRDVEFDAFGTDKEKLGKRLEDIMSELKTSWSPLGKVRGVSVTPKPMTDAGPPLWLGGRSAPPCRRAGRMADGFITVSGREEQLAEQAAWVREGLDAAGRSPEEFEFGALLPIFAWDGPDGWEQVRDGFHHVKWKYAEMTEQRFTPPPGPAPKALAGAEELDLRSQMVTGDTAELADFVARAIKAVRRELPGAKIHMVARSWWPGIDLTTQMKTADIFLTKVVPAALARC